MVVSKTTTLNKAFGITLARLRKKKKWNQETLGFESGLTRTYVSLLERGMASPTLNTIDTLAASLDTDAAQLVQLTLDELHTQMAALTGYLCSS
ncbi:MAG: helix-turn-helix transcriptional regulator [Pseudomonadota bacterium]